MAYLSYELARNPDKQEQLRNEIFQVVGESGKIDFDSLSIKSMPYLDAVVNEALRLYPVGLMVSNRMAMEDTTLLGYDIPKGLAIQPDVWTLHNDPSIWGEVDTSTFYPERWLGNEGNANMALAFLAFGIGPRTCVGKFSFK